MTIIDRANRFFNRRWVVIPAQPWLYAWLFAGSLWTMVGHLVYGVVYNSFLDMGFGLWMAWVSMGIVCPILWAVSTWIILCSNGIWLYRALWWRLSADAGMLTFLVIHCVYSFPIYFPRHPIHVVLDWFATVFVAVECVRDLWTLVSVEKLGMRLRSSGD